MSVLRVFAGIPGFLGLPRLADGYLLAVLKGLAGIFGPVSGAAVNRPSKSAGHRQKVSAVTGVSSGPGVLTALPHGFCENEKWHVKYGKGRP